MAFNEETIKVKIVLPLLHNFGFRLNDIELETSFYIKLGRNEYKIQSDRKKIGGRLDILCKSGEKNLFIFELKAENVNINKCDPSQALSYARLVQPMAPYAVLTNSKQTKIFDTITGKEIDKTVLSKQGFEFNISDELNIRYAALKSFIGYSKENLKIFCNTFNNNYLEYFRSSERDSIEQILNKKYIPEIYIKRKNIEEEFADFLNQSDSFIFPILGESGVGKTNTIINLYEQFADKYLSLFYSGTILSKNLLNQIKNDFNLCFSSEESETSILKKISVFSMQHPFIIYFDALDEWVCGDALQQIEQLSKILVMCNIRMCVSCKDLMWNNFLYYKSLPTVFSRNIYKKSHKLENFTSIEALENIEKFSKKFKSLQIPKETEMSENILNPFALRIACEVAFKNNTSVINTNDERETLKIFLDEKLKKSNDAEILKRFLLYISEILLKKNIVQVSENELRNNLKLAINEKLPIELLTLGFLYRTNEDFIGFYYSKIRDHIISLWILDLHNKQNKEIAEIIYQYKDSYIFENAINYFLKTSKKEELAKIIESMFIYDKKYFKSFTIRILSQQDKSFIKKIDMNTVNAILEHILFIISKTKNFAGYEIMTILKLICFKINIELFLIQILYLMKDNYDHSITYKTCELLEGGDNKEVTTELAKIVVDSMFNHEIRRFAIDPLFRRLNHSEKKEIFIALLEEYYNTDDGVLFYSNNYYSTIEDTELRNKMLYYFDNEKSTNSLKNIILHCLYDSKMPDTGKLLFERFLAKEYTDDVKFWIYRAICSNKYYKAIPIFIDVIKKDPDSELAGHILIGLGDMEAKNTVSTLIELCKNIKSYENVHWFSIVFVQLMNTEDTNKLIKIYDETDNKYTKFLILSTLIGFNNMIYDQIILESLKDVTVEDDLKGNLLQRWGKSLVETKTPRIGMVYVSEENIKNRKLEEKSIDSLYNFFEANNTLSMYALVILINFENSINKLATEIKTILPQLTTKFITNKHVLINIKNLEELSFHLNPWLIDKLRSKKFSNSVFLFNCIQLAGIFGNRDVLDALRFNRDIIVSQNVCSIAYVEQIEMLIRTSSDKIRTRLEI